MDAQTLASTAGIALGTLNIWVQRGIIPGEKVGRGRRRDFDRETTIRVALIAEMVGIGLAVTTASAITEQHGQHKTEYMALISNFALPTGYAIHDQNAWQTLQHHLRRSPVPIFFNSMEDLPKRFERFHIAPAVY